jgi:hypothetical protein
MLARVPAVQVVAEAASGEEAIQRTQDHQSQLLLLDIDMPDGDGFSVAEHIDAPLVVLPPRTRDTRLLLSRPTPLITSWSRSRKSGSNGRSRRYASDWPPARLYKRSTRRRKSLRRKSLRRTQPQR